MPAPRWRAARTCSDRASSASAQREAYAHATAVAMAQNVYLYCASEGLATVIRAWFDRDALARAMGLHPDHQLLLSQTVGAIKSVQAG